MTLREFFRELVVASRRERDLGELALATAWHAAYFHRVKQFPTLKSIFKRKEQPLNLAQQRSVMHILSAKYGIPLRRVDKKDLKKSTHG